MSRVIVRPEVANDGDAIFAVNASAFGRPDEAALVDHLRAGGDLLVSLVAVDGDDVIGHVAFSRGIIEPNVPVVTLGPIGVVAARQGEGIGSALVHVGIERCREAREIALFLLGDPDFYGRFGFSVEAAAPFDSPYAGSHFQALVLRNAELPDGGTLHYPAAFAALG